MPSLVGLLLFGMATAPATLAGAGQCPEGFVVEHQLTPPQALPEAIQLRRDASSLELIRGGKAVAVMWSVASPQEGHSEEPAPIHPMPGTRHVFSGIKAGTRVGLLRVLEPAADARGTAIPTGEYSAFYGVQPPFKDHLGTSALRDFAILLPLDLDDGRSYEQHDLLTRIRVEFAAHALVLRILPEDSAEAIAGCNSELALRGGVRDGSLRLTFDASARSPSSER